MKPVKEEAVSEATRIKVKALVEIVRNEPEEVRSTALELIHAILPRCTAKHDGPCVGVASARMFLESAKELGFGLNSVIGRRE